MQTLLIENILNNKDADAYELLSKSIKNKCIGLVINKYRVNESESISILFEAFLELCDRVRKKLFTFKDEVSFTAYLKKICLTKAKAYKKEVVGETFIYSTEQFEQMESMMQMEIQQAKDDIYDAKKQRYGIDLASLDSSGDVSNKRIVEAYHSLREECKMLLMLKDILKSKYSTIVDALGFFYKIKNENVCRIQVMRCRKALKEKLKDLNVKSYECHK